MDANDILVTVQPAQFGELMNGKKPISKELAYKLEQELGISVGS